MPEWPNQLIVLLIHSRYLKSLLQLVGSSECGSSNWGCSIFNQRRFYHTLLFPRPGARHCWEFCDGDAMRKVPNDVISKYSQHFQVINCKPVGHTGPFRCKNLQALKACDTNAHCRKLINELQPSLLAFDWATGTDKTTRGILDLSSCGEGNAMKLSMVATTMTDLKLRNWIADDIPQLLSFLTRYSRLSKISLLNISGIDEFPYLASKTANMSLPQPYIILPTITKLCLDCDVQESPAVFEMVACCPNLTHLEVVGSWMPSEGMYANTSIYLYCPNLRSFTIIRSVYRIGREIYTPNEDDFANLIANLTGPPGTGKLDTFEATLLEFNKTTSQALVKHTRDSLEVFKLTMDDMYQYANMNTPRKPLKTIHHILTNCCNLKILALRYSCELYSSDYLDGSWACLETLEELRIHAYGVWLTPPQKMGDVEVVNGDGSIWIWCIEAKVRVPLALWSSISDKVKQMPRLRRFSINDKLVSKFRKASSSK